MKGNDLNKMNTLLYKVDMKCEDETLKMYFLGIFFLFLYIVPNYI